MRLLLVLVALVAAVSAERVSYEGYKVYQVIPKNEQEVTVLKHLETYELIDFWSPLRRVAAPVNIMVPPSLENVFFELLDSAHIQHTVLIENVETKFEIERQLLNIIPRAPAGRINLNRFNRHDDITAYLNQLAAEHPDIASVETIGQSYEGRDMNIIKISTGGTGAKPAIFIDGGIHAREWLAPAEVLCIISSLVEDPNNRGLIESVDWYILPVVNPDGYEYSHSSERLWRKTRSRGNQCYGADPNRNFDFHWMEVGASSYECSITYGGSKAFSEVEAVAVASFLQKHSNSIKLYLTFHSYGQYILYPWGFTSSYPENVKELDGLAHQVDDAISSVAGTRYTIGSSTNVLYPAAGGSDDWSKGVAGIPLAYTIEMPGGGANGFDPPASLIEPVCTETWEGIKVYGNYIKNNY